MTAYHNRSKGIGRVHENIYLVNGARTGFGKLHGTIARVSPTDLGIFAAKAAIERSEVSPDQIDQVICSNLTQSSKDAYFMPRHVGICSGVPYTVPTLLVQRLCATGFETIITASEQIELGKAEVVLSAAAENMSLSPLVSYGARMGFPMGNPQFFDFLSESLKDTATEGHMGCTAENLAKEFGISREEVDAYALRSQESAIAAKEFLEGEMCEVVSTVFEAPGVNPRKVRLPRRVESFMSDEHPRATTLDKLAKLPAVFKGDGVHTAGNSSGIVDGAAAVCVASAEWCRQNGKTPLVKVVASASAGVEPHRMGIGPVPAIEILLEMTGMSLEQIGLVEINEAFSGQFLACEKALGLDRSICNVNGGAIALGHPLSVSGLRITLTAAREMERKGIRYGIVSACVGGGQGTAILLENEQA